MTAGGDFPTVTPAGEQEWWVVNDITRPGGPRGPQQTNYKVVQSASRPTNAVAGPFTTQAEAQQWMSSATAAGSNPVSAIGLPNPLSALTEIGHWIGALVTALTDFAMWRSLGWLVLGLILIWIGVLLWLRIPQRAAGIATNIAASKI